MTDIQEAWEIPDSDVPDSVADEVLDEVTKEMGITPLELDMGALRRFEAEQRPKPVRRTPLRRVG